MVFYNDEEQKKMEHAYLIRLQRNPRNPITNKIGIDANKKIEAISDSYNYFKSYLYQKLIYNNPKINLNAFKDILNNLYELSDQMLFDIDCGNLEFDFIPTHFDTPTFNSLPDIIKEIKRYHFETHNKKGQLCKLYHLLTVVYNVSALYLNKYYNIEVHNKIVDLYSDNLINKIWFKDLELDKDLNEIYNNLMKYLRYSIPVAEEL